MYVGVYF